MFFSFYNHSSQYRTIRIELYRVTKVLYCRYIVNMLMNHKLEKYVSYGSYSTIYSYVGLNWILFIYS